MLAVLDHRRVPVLAVVEGAAVQAERAAAVEAVAARASPRRLGVDASAPSAAGAGLEPLVEAAVEARVCEEQVAGVVECVHDRLGALVAVTMSEAHQRERVGGDDLESFIVIHP